MHARSPKRGGAITSASASSSSAHGSEETSAVIVSVGRHDFAEFTTLLYVVSAETAPIGLTAEDQDWHPVRGRLLPGADFMINASLTDYRDLFNRNYVTMRTCGDSACSIHGLLGQPVRLASGLYELRCVGNLAGARALMARVLSADFDSMVRRLGAWQPFGECLPEFME